MQQKEAMKRALEIMSEGADSVPRRHFRVRAIPVDPSHALPTDEWKVVEKLGPGHQRSVENWKEV